MRDETSKFGCANRTKRTLPLQWGTWSWSKLLLLTAKEAASQFRIWQTFFRKNTDASEPRTWPPLGATAGPLLAEACPLRNTTMKMLPRSYRSMLPVSSDGKREEQPQLCFFLF